MPRKKTHEEFVKEVFDLVGHDYTVVGKYTTTNKKIELKHNSCGKVFNMRASAFLYGQRCSNCFRPEKKTQKEFEKEVFDLVSDEYSVLGEYKNNKVKVLMKHNICGHEYDVTPGHFFTTGRRCPKCNGGIKREDYNFNEHVHDYSNGEYKPITDYKNNKTHVLMKHIICGTTWEVRPDNFFSGKGCPVCNESFGEREIRKYLIKNRITFQSQYRFDDCRNKRPLPFDFAIMNKDKVIGLIEFQGEQHYREVDFFGGKEGLVQRKKNDNIKKRYCKDNNIPLLIIKFDEVIENKLNDFFKYYANPEPSVLEIV